jgi:hypothetical protein
MLVAKRLVCLSLLSLLSLIEYSQDRFKDFEMLPCRVGSSKYWMMLKGLAMDKHSSLLGGSMSDKSLMIFLITIIAIKLALFVADAQKNKLECLFISTKPLQPGLCIIIIITTVINSKY